MILADSEATHVASRSTHSPGEPLEAAGRGGRVALSASAGLIQRLVQGAGAVAVVPLMLKALGTPGFGIWGAATSLAWLISMLDLGLGAALVTLVASEKALGREVDARRHVTGTFVGATMLGAATLLLSLLIVALAVPRGQQGPYLIAVVGLAINVPLNGVSCVWMALQKNYVASSWETFQTVAILSGLGAASLATSDVRIYVAVVYGGFALASLGSLIHLMIAHPELRPDFRDAPREAVRRVAGKGMMYFLTALVGGFTYLFDNILALQLLGPVASAQMTIAARICLAGGGILTIVSQPFWPAFADAAARGHIHWIRRNLVRGTSLVLAAGIVGSAMVITLGGPLLRWWLHRDLGIDRSLLWAIAAWIAVQAAGRVPCFFLYAVRVVRYQFVMASIATSMALVLKFLWAPRMGVAGILWASTLSGLLVNLTCLAWRSNRWLREHAPQGSSLL